MPRRHAIPDGRQVGGPAPRRAPLPRRRVRRGCADPAPPAGPSGAAGSGQPLGTLRSPPRPRGGANRAGERAPRSRTYNSQRGGSGSTEIWPLTNFWPGSMYIGLRWSLIPSYNRQNALVFYGLAQARSATVGPHIERVVRFESEGDGGAFDVVWRWVGYLRSPKW